MKKKFALPIVLALLLASTAFVLVACGVAGTTTPTADHVHVPGTAVEENRIDATCSEVGSYDEAVYCSECGEEISRERKELPKVDHDRVTVEEIIEAPTCTMDGSCNRIVRCSLCEKVLSREENMIVFASHSIENGVCGRCGFSPATDLDFKLNADGKGYTLIALKNKSLTALEITTHLGLPVTAIGEEVFSGSRLQRVTLGEGVVSIGRRAFYECKSLSSVSLSAGLEEIGAYAFSDCTSLKSITLPDGLKSIGGYSFAGCESLRELSLPDGLKSIGGYSFAGCESLRELSLPEGMTSVGNFSFAGCSDLATVSLPSTLTELGSSSFSDCPSLKLTVYDNAGYIGNTSNPYLALVAANNKSITSCTINANTKFIMVSAFDSCRNLSKIDLPSGLLGIGGYAFAWCSSLGEITVPDSVTVIGNNAFCNCEGLARVTLGRGAADIRSATFGACISLRELVIPEGVVTIGDGAFADCLSLVSLRLPDSLRTVGTRAFEGCSSLEFVDFGSGIESLGGGAFIECFALTSVAVPAKSATAEINSMHWYKLTRVFVKGSEADASGLTLSGPHPDQLSAVRLYYYSENNIGGDVWRYVDGVPTLWN